MSGLLRYFQDSTKRKAYIVTQLALDRTLKKVTNNPNVLYSIHSALSAIYYPELEAAYGWSVK